jgi:hypothetical protein
MTSARAHSHRLLPVVLLLGIATTQEVACIHAPPEVAQAHQREYDLIESLQATHLAMIDAFVAERAQRFDAFFFHDYAPAYFANWKSQFKIVNGRDYDEARDFALFSNDLVAEYQDLVSPLDTIRLQLHQAVVAAYADIALLHQGVGDWIQSVQKLNDAQRSSLNRLLGAVKPGLTLDTIEQATDRALAAVKSKLAALNQ